MGGFGFDFLVTGGLTASGFGFGFFGSGFGLQSGTSGGCGFLTADDFDFDLCVDTMCFDLDL